MIPDENVDPQKEMKNIRNCKDVGKYRIFKKKKLLKGKLTVQCKK